MYFSRWSLAFPNTHASVDTRASRLFVFRSGPVDLGWRTRKSSFPVSRLNPRRCRSALPRVWSSENYRKGKVLYGNSKQPEKGRELSQALTVAKKGLWRSEWRCWMPCSYCSMWLHARAASLTPIVVGIRHLL